jgi:hypothetical protein
VRLPVLLRRCIHAKTPTLEAPSEINDKATISRGGQLQRYTRYVFPVVARQLACHVEVYSCKNPNVGDQLQRYIKKGFVVVACAARLPR